MLLPRLQPPLRAAITSIGRSGGSSASQACLVDAFAALNVCKRAVVGRGQGLRVSGVRYASHKAQGAVNKAKDGPGKRLGAKKSGEQYVIPGNIIFRQRGTHWFPGENCGMGRDHTIYATHHGYVKYYKDPEKHPKRQYIGVTFERDMVLPLPRNSMRRRRLGMTASRIEEMHTSALEPVLEGDAADGDEVATPLATKAPSAPKPQAAPATVTLLPGRKEKKGDEGRTFTLRPGYMYRESNWEIGRAAERAKIQIREFKPRDRWTAWKKSTVRKRAAAAKRGLSRKVRPKK